MSTPHRDVAERFTYFFDVAGLDRESFTEGIDGALAPRSIHAVLAGTRRPSRALAVLIERTWGFRAEYLLDGKGDAWTTPAQPPERTLNPDEEEVVRFMRRSMDNARSIRVELDRAELWEKLFGRTTDLLRALERCAASEDPAVLSTYPLLAKFVFDECRFIADRYGELGSMLHDRRVLRLTEEYLRRFLVEIPGELVERGAMKPDAAAGVVEVAEPLLRDLRAEGDRLHDEATTMRSSVEGICDLELPDELIDGRRVGRSLLHGRAVQELAAQLEAVLGDDEWAALEPTVTDALASLPPTPDIGEQLRAVTDDVAVTLRDRSGGAPDSVAALRAVHRRAVSSATTLP